MKDITLRVDDYDLDFLCADELDDLIGLVDSCLSPLPDFILPPFEEPGKRQRKALSLLGNALFFLALAAILVAAVSRNMGGNGVRNLAGCSMFNVLTESMQSVLPQGSLVLTKRTDPRDLQIGDDITFMVSENASVTHRVVGIIENHEGGGARGFETKGVENERPDREVVYASNVVGKVIFHVPYVGAAMVAVSEHWLLLVLPFGGILVFASLLKFLFAKDVSGKKKKRKQAVYPEFLPA